MQALLCTVREVADKHVVDGKRVAIAKVSTRSVLEQSAVAAVIVGVRRGHSEHIVQNKISFQFELSRCDHQAIDGVLAGLKSIPGDCGDEYRRPPFLPASGDLSHHLESVPNAFKVVPLPGPTPAPRRACASRPFLLVLRMPSPAHPRHAPCAAEGVSASRALLPRTLAQRRCRRQRCRGSCAFLRSTTPKRRCERWVAVWPT